MTLKVYTCNKSFKLVYFNLIALNGDNISADRYVYIALNGVVEGIAYVATVPLLIYVGRKKAVSGLFFMSGILQLTLFTISHKGRYNNIMHIKKILIHACIKQFNINIDNIVFKCHFRTASTFIVYGYAWKILCKCCIFSMFTFHIRTVSNCHKKYWTRNIIDYFSNRNYNCAICS